MFALSGWLKSAFLTPVLNGLQAALANGTNLTQSLDLLVRPQTETYTYDADGNVLTDGLWNYTWDAENRLIRLSTTTARIHWGAPHITITYAYDFQGRRYKKTVANPNASPHAPTTGTTHFVYDGWNLIAEYTPQISNSQILNLQRTYTWGLDLTSSLSASGGIGALLAISQISSANSQTSNPATPTSQISNPQISSTYYPTYDANGNITALVDPTRTGTTLADGPIVAAYEYDPYGQLLRNEAFTPEAKQNPFRFSTKYRDHESGFYYYGFRYYNPSTGRWPSRDPIEEEGGINLYGFCWNTPTSYVDDLGASPYAPIGPKPPTAQDMEGLRQDAFELIKNRGNVAEGLPQKLLRQWLWAKGNYELTDAEFAQHAWGDKNYRVYNVGGIKSPKGILTLKLIDRFNSDLNSNCKSGGETFTGNYLFLDYANTGRTIGNFFWYIEVSVKCGCRKGDYEASGTIHIQDPYDFNAGGRNAVDEAAVRDMRWFHNITRMGQDFTVTSKKYPVSEKSPRSSNPMDHPYLERP